MPPCRHSMARTSRRLEKGAREEKRGLIRKASWGHGKGGRADGMRGDGAAVNMRDRVTEIYV